VKQDGIGYQGIYRCFEIIDIFECIRMHNLAVKQMAFHSFRDLKADLPKSEHDTKNRCEVEITSRDNSYECLRLQTDALMPTLKKLYEKFKEKNRKISTTTETLHLAHPDDSRKKVEYFVSAPKAHNGELPVLVFIHGHQSEQPTGGKIFIDRESVNYVKKGFLVASISQPGYGNSDGPADFCGPFTQSAVRAVITELKKRPDVNPNQIFLYGESRGAVVAAMVGAQDGTLKGLILDAGFYDLRKVTDQQTRDNFTNEVQGTLPSLTEAQREEAMHLRSVSDWHAQLKSDVLMFHGARDPRAPFPSAMDFYYKLCDSDLYVNLHYFDCEHHTPDDKREYFIDIFLEERTK
ncbi:MAG TPA: prolyl oligopeptidase family serine peptidase, partial [Myxococcota bacterium]|nr:prolyl oligopeptidase family serine peptidase [Myxococcota bacterium]